MTTKVSFSSQEALDYHSEGKPGKIEVVSTKPCKTQKDLSLAYSPGVAEPCKVIKDNPLLAGKYTARSNLVAVVSDGTAVLGLGNIGALASKPVMEGKGILFKTFAGIDVFDIELADHNPDGSLKTISTDDFIRTVAAMEPTFGGINLEDIKSPECFRIEKELKEKMNIPVFHDDQHGTAIISAAALINAVEIQGKKLDSIRVVFSGAGAAAISCAHHYVNIGVKKSNIMLVDINGVVYKGRQHEMDEYKNEFAVETNYRTLQEAMQGADVLVGLSTADVVSQEMVKSMAPKAIVFALANPNPEINYDVAKAIRPDIIMATGRSDYPNQVNNVLGFPFIFRGVLDVQATAINEEMKIAATHALVAVTKDPAVPQAVLDAYGVKKLEFSADYIIPKPLDSRVLIVESMAVARAAMESGVAQKPIENWQDYQQKLTALIKK